MSANYQAFLLRLQRSATSARWRGVLKDIENNDEVTFSNPYELFDYLLETVFREPSARDAITPTVNMNDDRRYE